MPASIRTADARVFVSMRYCVGSINWFPPSINRTRKQATWPQDHHNQKGDVTGKYLPFGVHLRADGLREADNDAARERAPEAPEAADDHRFECVDQPGRTNRPIEISADT